MGDLKTLITAEQLSDIANGRRVELVRGEIAEMSPVGKSHSEIVIVLGSWLLSFVRAKKLGAVGTERGFVLSRDPDVVRAPDVHFIRGERLANDNPGYFDGAPDLTVEVLSPEDRASDVEQKIAQYLSAGSGLVLKVDPANKTVTRYLPGGEVRILSGDETVACEPPLPGFSFRASDLFLP